MARLPDGNPRQFSAGLKRKDPDQAVAKGSTGTIQEIKTAASIIAKAAGIAMKRIDRTLDASDTGARAYTPMSPSYENRPITTRELVKRMDSDGLDRMK